MYLLPFVQWPLFRDLHTVLDGLAAGDSAAKGPEPDPPQLHTMIEAATV